MATGVPFQLAISTGNAEIVRRLVDAGADVNAGVPIPRKQEEEISSAWGRDVAMTPLFLAVLRGQTDIVEALLEEGANPNNELSPFSVLAAAASQGYIDTVQLLVNAGANVAPRFGTTADRSSAALGIALSPLLLAINGEHTEIVELLIDAGAYTCADGFSRVMFDLLYRTTLRSSAAATGNEEVLALLDLARERCDS